MAQEILLVSHQQIEAYKFVYIHGCCYEEAARLMGCTESNICQLLRRLKKSHPEIFPPKKSPVTYKATVRWRAKQP